jgi:hypothetical protein
VSFESYHGDIKYYMTLNTIFSVVTLLQAMWKMALRYMHWAYLVTFGYLILGTGITVYMKEPGFGIDFKLL